MIRPVGRGYFNKKLTNVTCCGERYYAQDSHVFGQFGIITLKTLKKYSIGCYFFVQTDIVLWPKHKRLANRGILHYHTGLLVSLRTKR